MAGKAEIFVGVINDGATVGAGAGAGATAVSDQFFVNGTGMVLLNQTAQTDIRDGAEFKTGDVVSLVGNVAGVIATMAVQNE
ncbi:hypothetical protein J2W17_001294 [Pseudomonas lini]|uniref:hypothetical protein n=1 Tax=Pseudomonas lini TaxID=163011 RepID=UPI00278B2B2C|nr:hypothetical protein [Pseudomonas lini]MDQ0122349.1 hypothetical protein [Pseudomonas lini]